MTMRLLSLSFLLFFSSHLMARIEFHPPADWVEMEAPSKMPPQVIYLKKVKSPDEVIQITVIATEPVLSVSQAQGYLSGALHGMRNKGHTEQLVSDTVIDGFPVKHIVGEFRSDEYEGAYLTETKIFFTDQAVVNVSVSIDDAGGGRDLAAPLFDWVKIPGSPVVFSAVDPVYSKNYQMGQKVGQYSFWVVVAVGLFLLIRWSKRKTKSKLADAEARKRDSVDS